MSEAQATSLSSIDEVVRCYGDLLYDFCESILWSPQNAQLGFRRILSEIRKRKATRPFKTHERAWVLQIACSGLNEFGNRYARRLTAAEQIQIDSHIDVSNRLRHFDAFFHRLPLEDQMLLLLKDKYGLPYPELASALGTPEGTLKVQRQQALRTLEEWIWNAG